MLESLGYTGHHKNIPIIPFVQMRRQTREADFLPKANQLVSDRVKIPAGSV